MSEKSRIWASAGKVELGRVSEKGRIHASVGKGRIQVSVGKVEIRASARKVEIRASSGKVEFGRVS